jgi:hypothetical protein
VKKTLRVADPTLSPSRWKLPALSVNVSKLVPTTVTRAFSTKLPVRELITRPAIAPVAGGSAAARAQRRNAHESE